MPTFLCDLTAFLSWFQLEDAQEVAQQVAAKHISMTILLAASLTLMHAMHKDLGEVNRIIRALPEQIPNLHNDPLRWRPWDTAIEVRFQCGLG